MDHPPQPSPASLIGARRWDDLVALLLDLRFLEAKTEAGLVFDLAMDFTRAVAALPPDHPACRNLRLIEQALRRDIHFIARHPTTLFQCLWNQCWWCDCPGAAAHYDPPAAGWPPEGPPWARPEADRLSTLLESWRAEKEQAAPGFVWIRSLRPPQFPLGGAELLRLGGHEDEVNNVAFSPDGRRLATASDDGTARVWDAETGAELVRLTGHEHQVTGVAFSLDGRRVATASDDGTARVWDAATGAELVRLTGHEHAVSGVAFSPDGRRVATAGSYDETARIWDAATGAELVRLTGHGREGESLCGINAVAFSPDGRRLATTSTDNTARVWDAATGAELTRLRGHGDHINLNWGINLGVVNGVAFSPDGRRLATAADDGTARVWDAETGAELIRLRWRAFFRSVAFSPDGQRLATAADDKTARVWDAVTGAELVRLSGHEDDLTSVAFSPDGRRIATASWDKTARVWDPALAAKLPRLTGHEGMVNNVMFSPDGRRIATTSDDKTTRVWDAETGAELVRLSGYEDRVGRAAFSPDGRRIATTSLDGTARVWDALTGACLEVIQSPDDGVAAIAADWETVRKFPWRAILHDQQNEVAVELTAGGEAIAWFPAIVYDMVPHPSGRKWAYESGDNLYIIQLEGEPRARGLDERGDA